MSDWFEYSCDKCKVIVGGWNESPPYRCPVCGAENGKDDDEGWHNHS